MSGRRDVFEQAMRQGHFAAWDQQWDRAIAAYRKAVEEFPEDPNALSSLGLALLQAKRLDEALAVYQRAGQLAPDDPVALEKSADILERLGRLDEASQRYLSVAEIHLSRRDVDKAIDLWARATRLAPGLLAAHHRLALAYERTGKTKQAILEYLSIARIYQRNGDYEKARQAVERARALEPKNTDVLRALDILDQGAELPEVQAPRAMTSGVLRAAQAFAAPETLQASAGTTAPPPAARKATASPVDAARQKALAALVAYLFDESAEERTSGAGMSATTKSTPSSLRGTASNRAVILTYLGQAIDAQSRDDADSAIAGYEKALGAGLNHAAANLCLGLLYAERGVSDAAATGVREDAVNQLRAARIQPDYRAGANFAIGQIYKSEGKPREAIGPLLDVLRDVDLQTVPADKHEDLAQMYETLTESLSRSGDEAQVATVAENLIGFLSGDGWQERVQAARKQLDANNDDGALAPLAEMLSMPGTDQVFKSLHFIDQYIEKGFLPAAMEECYHAIEYAPAYLPVHLRMAEILVKENRLEAAIVKYAAVAETYRVRGDTRRAGAILQEVVRLAPMDLNVRSRLIDLLILQDKTDEALSQYLDLAETYYRLADLDGARQTFSNALRLAQRSSVDRAWSVQILHQMGDIDMQRLDWRQAVRVYQQIKTLAPSDEKARGLLVELDLRLGQKSQAMTEVDDLLRFRMQAAQVDEAIAFLEELVRQHPQETGFRTRLARLYQERGRKADAIAQLDAIGEMQLQAGQNAEAAETVRAILALGPSNVEAYQQLLSQIAGR